MILAVTEQQLTLLQPTNFRLFQTELAQDNFKFDEIERKFSKPVENKVGKEKLLVMSSLSFSYSVFRRLVL